MKQKKIFFLIILFAIFFSYMTNIEKIPKNITLYQNEKYKVKYLKGLEIKGDNVKTEENFWSKLATINTDFIGKIELKLSTLGGFLNKKITVNVVPTMEVIPGGDLIGVKLYSKGVLIVGQSKVQAEDGNWYEMFPEDTFKAGDILYRINDYDVESAEDVSRIINEIGEEQIKLTYERNDEKLETMITPIKNFEDGLYKIGLWVRDGAMGVGTLTFYSPEYYSYAALGHGISDEDSKELIKVGDGEIYDAKVIAVTKGRNEYPGELKGFLNESLQYGDIDLNSKNGIYGSYSGDEVFNYREKVEVASKNEVQLGKAKIRCTIDESQEVKEYDIEIIKMSASPFNESKGMIIKVTDKELINKTGGIIQGMSGSPILQNGKLIGAVTHVYVNDPTKGYAIFAQTMIDEIEK